VADADSAGRPYCSHQSVADADSAGRPYCSHQPLADADSAGRPFRTLEFAILSVPGLSERRE